MKREICLDVPSCLPANNISLGLSEDGRGGMCRGQVIFTTDATLEPNWLMVRDRPYGIILIDIYNVRGAIESIENILERDIYHSRIKEIDDCRKWAIKKSNPYRKAAESIINLNSANYSKEDNLLDVQLIKGIPLRHAAKIYSFATRLIDEAGASALLQAYKKIKKFI